MTITTRAGKGSALTHAELDGNFDHFSARSHFGTVANEAAMVALSLAVPGASCTRTDTGTVWILATGTYATAGNWQDTGSGDTLPQYAISGATSITRADHCNRVGVNSTASNYTLTIQTDALGGYTGNEIVYGFQGSTGTVTIAASGATLQQPTGSKLTTTSAGDYVSAQRIGVDTWAITSVAGGTTAGFTDIADSSELALLTQYRMARVQNANATTIFYINQATITTRDSSTAVAVAHNTTDLTGRTTRMLYRSAANAVNRAAGFGFGGSTYLTGQAVANGPWPFNAVAGIGDASPTLGTLLIGLQDGSHTLGATTLVGANNYVCVGCEDGDANLQVLVKRALSATIKIDMGATWARSGLSGVLLSITIHRNDDGTEFYFRVKNVNTGATYLRTVTSADGLLPTTSTGTLQLLTRESCASAFQAELLFAAFSQGRPA